MIKLLAYQVRAAVLAMALAVVGSVPRFQVTGIAKPRRVGISTLAQLLAALAMIGRCIVAAGIGPLLGGAMPVLVISHDEDAAIAFLAKMREWSERFAAMFGDPSMRVVESSATRYKLANGMEARAFGDSVKAARGFEGLIVWDEACFARDGAAMWAAIRAAADPTLARPHGFPVIVISTAWREDAFAWQIISGDGSAADRFAHVQRLALTLPECLDDGFPYEMTPDERGAYVERIRLETGDDDVFGAEYMNRPLSSHGAFLDSAIIASCQYDAPEWPAEGYVGIGVDVGAVRDLTAIAHAKATPDGVVWVAAVETHRRMPLAQQDARFAEVMNAGPSVACIDAGGLGLPSAQRLAAHAPGRVESFTFTAQSKAELAEAFRHAVLTGKVRLPRQRELLQDFGALRREPRSGGGFAYEGRTSGSHCDLAWAVMLAYRAAARSAYHDANPDEWHRAPRPRPDTDGLRREFPPLRRQSTWP